METMGGVVGVMESSGGVVVGDNGEYTTDCLAAEKREWPWWDGEEDLLPEVIAVVSRLDLGMLPS